MLETLIELDQSLFLTLNQLHTSWLDPVMLFVSYNKIFMLSILGLIFIHGFRKFKKKFFFVLIAMLFVFGLSDSISSRVFKPGFKRLRPCHEEVLKEKVHLAGKKCWGGKFGFVSSHAANSFALALFFWLIFRQKIYYLMFGFAGLASYSRIYLAKHYPLDLLCGGILGMIIAYSIYKILLKLVPTIATKNNRL